MAGELDGQGAIITGGGRGIGRASAAAMPRLGWFLVTCVACLLTACRGGADAPTAGPAPGATPAATSAQPAAAPSLPPGAARADGLREEWRIPVPSPNGLAVDGHGRSYAGSSAPDSHVRVFDQRGMPLGQWGGVTGKAPGEFDYITSLALDAAGNVYVADFNNRRIQKFDPDGRLLLVIPTEPPAGPTEVPVDAAGFIYVANHRRHDHAVQKFDAAGKLVAAWGEPGKGPGQFAAGSTGGPDQVALDAEGNVYVSDPDNARVQQFDADGRFLRTFGDAAATASSSAAPTGSRWTARAMSTARSKAARSASSNATAK